MTAMLDGPSSRVVPPVVPPGGQKPAPPTLYYSSTSPPTKSSATPPLPAAKPSETRQQLLVSTPVFDGEEVASDVVDEATSVEPNEAVAEEPKLRLVDPPRRPRPPQRDFNDEPEMKEASIAEMLEALGIIAEGVTTGFSGFDLWDRELYLCNLLVASGQPGAKRPRIGFIRLLGNDKKILVGMMYRLQGAGYLVERPTE